jgi:hypoxanthine phosphoribosyltransferase
VLVSLRSGGGSLRIGRTLLSEEAIRKRTIELAGQISADYRDSDGLLMVGVLRGAFIFLADLARLVEVPVQIDFIALSSYERGSERSGAVRLVLDLRSDIVGRDVLVVEDIVDTGYTLQYLTGMLGARRPRTLRTCSLVRKPGQLQVDVEVDYLGFDIPDLWVVGWGLDYGDRYRNLPFVAELVIDSGEEPP